MAINPSEKFGEKGYGDYGGLEHSVDWPKVRGTMLKFARETDEIVGGEESPTAELFYSNWIQWMQKKTNGRMVVWISTYQLRDDMVEKIREFYKKSEEFKELIHEKYKQKDDTEYQQEEVSEEEDSEDDGESSDKTEHEESEEDVGGTELDKAERGGPGLGDFADEYGTTDSLDSGSSKNEIGYTTIGPAVKRKNHSKDNLRAHKEDIEDIRNEIMLGNVFEVVDRIPDDSVDAVVTSPPYWNLRDYEGDNVAVIGGKTSCNHNWHDNECTKCGAWEGQLGAEPTPEMFVDHLMTLFQKIGRILKPTGSVWLNIGDTYAGQDHKDSVGARRKSAAMVPQRLYVRMVSNGWIARDRIVWAKQVINKDKEATGATNPGSWEDRVNDTWEPMWRFTQEPDYYADMFDIRRQHQTDGPDEEELKERYEGKYNSGNIDDENINSPTARMARDGYTPSLRHENGALPPDVWRLPTGSTELEHTAVFSEELVKWPIQMTVPKKTCPVCGSPYERQTEGGKTTSWELTCRHDDVEETKPGIVFEPFIGRGTTAKVASDLGRDYIGVEISEKYLDFAEDFVPNDKQVGIMDYT